VGTLSINPERVTIVDMLGDVFGAGSQVRPRWSASGLEYLSLTEYRALVGPEQLDLELEVCLPDHLLRRLRAFLG
jgi:hypothetical protein